jgi:hypothetical protein
MNTVLEHPQGPPPGIVVNRSPDPARVYLGSPSLVRLVDGTMLISHDWFGPGTNNDQVSVHASADGGNAWQEIARLQNLFWPSLFVHGAASYLIGNTHLYGDVVIRRSTDKGRTWTEALDEDTGILRRGRAHGAPVPVVVHAGRIWRGVEAVVGDEDWPRHFHSMVMSAPVDADLLQAQSWIFSAPLPFDREWISGERPGWLEGNVIVAPDGSLRNLLRTHAAPGINDPLPLSGVLATIPRWELAALGRVAADGRRMDFDPGKDFIHFPGSQSKFTVRFDSVSGRYWSLVQKITNIHAGYDWRYSPYHQRNVLLLISSADLLHWREERLVLRYREGRVVQAESPVGFQYADWQFDADDLLVALRTAWAGAANYHDANLITFHRVPDFRQPAPPPPDLAE